MKKHFYISLILLLGVAAKALPQSMTISGGDTYGMIICAKGLVYAWGNNANQVLGIAPPSASDPETAGNTPAAAYITSPQKVKIPAGLTMQQVVAGSGSFSTALSCQNIVYCWGSNQNGECGQGSTSQVISFPSPVLKGVTAGSTEPGMGAYLGDVKYVAAATASAYAILTNGRCVAWGSNKSVPSTGSPNLGGQLGAGLPNTTNQTTPVWVVDGSKAGNPPLENVIHVAGGDYTAYFLVDDGSGNGTGTVYSCGDWHGRTGSSTVAMPVLKDDNTILTGVSMMAAGDVLGVAVEKATGNVYGWGNNGWGCCAGIPANAAAPRASKVVSGQYEKISGEAYLSDVVEVIGGRGYAAAITKEGYMLYWGNNENIGGYAPNNYIKGDMCDTGPQFAVYCNAAGNPYTVNTTNKTTINASTGLVNNAVHLARGDVFGFMVNNKNEYYAWGMNDKGQLGLGLPTTTHRHCLQELKNIPCDMPDPMPQVFMVSKMEKCFGQPFTLYSGFTPAVGKESLYDYEWYSAPKQGDPETQLLPASKYNFNEISILDPGFYRVKVRYTGLNAPCNVVDEVEATTTVTDKVMPIDTLIISSCVADPLAPKATDYINFQFKSKYTIPSEFEVYATSTSTAVLKTVQATAADPNAVFSVTGNNIAISEIHDNAPVDTTYTLWVLDKTKEKGTVIKTSAVPATDGGNQKYYTLLECWNSVTLETVDLYLQSYYGSKTATITPVIYSVIKNNNRDMPGAVIWTGAAQSFTYDSDKSYLAQVKFNDYQLTGNTSRGTKYYLGFTINNADKIMVSTALVKTGNDDNIFVTPFKDDIDQSTLLAIGASEGGNPTNKYAITNLKFSKLSAYDCNRMKITSRYYCPPCLKPDKSLPNGKSVEIAISSAHTATAKKVSMCKESGDLTLTTNPLKLSGTVNATQFDITWYKGAVEISPATTASATSITVKWDTDVPVGTKQMYVVRVTDHAKFPAEACPVYDTVYVEALAVPTVNPAVSSYCENTTPPALPAISGFTTVWKDQNGTVVTGIGALPAGITNYTVQATNTTTGCKSDITTMPITVVASPLTPLAGTVVYYKSDAAASGKFDNILVQDAKAAIPAISQDPANYTLEWANSSTGPWSSTVPTIPDLIAGDTQDKNYTFYVRRKATGTPACVSDAGAITVKLYLTPVPITSPISYCEGETATPLTAQKDLGSYADNQIDLKWYSSDDPSALLPGAPTPSTTTPGTFTYYVSQYNNSTSAESSRASLEVTVYAKPALTVTNPAAECSTLGKTVDITGKNTVWSVSNEGILPLEVYYYGNDKVTTLANPSTLSTVGSNTYYIKAEFAMPANAGGLPLCSSDLKPVTVVVENLKVDIVGSEKACPEDDILLTSSLTTDYNSGIASPVYSWSGNGNTGANSSFNTGALPATKGTIVNVNLTVSAGSCKNIQAAIHGITIGDGAIDGTMDISEPGSTNPAKTFQPNDVKEFYSCGGDISIVTSYTNTDANSFVWYIGSTKVHEGKDLLITDMAAPETRTYRLEYVNGCPTSVTVVVHSVPLLVSNGLVASDMGMCEDDKFEAVLDITCSENPVTKIEWFKDGSPIGGNQATFTITETKPGNSGVYSYVVTNRGCVVPGDIAGGTKLNVSDKVKAGKLPMQEVCAGNEVTIGLDWVTPATSVLNWRDPDGTIQGSATGWTVNATPPFRPGSGHRSTYTYTIDAKYDYCSTTLEVQVYVDELLENAGTIDDQVICEGNSAVLNAASYNADTYSWTSDSFDGFKTTAAITESPVTTTYYSLHMKRGVCEANDNATITVNSKPRIQSIDSIGVRDREIVAAAGYGTHPLRFGVDNETPTSDAIKRNLLFKNHTFYVIDALDCVSSTTEYYLEAPKIVPPPHFSPNGDSQFDTWDVPGIQDIYPDAIVSIYDRFGKKLIEYKGSAESGWDGKYLGRDMPATDYWYEINIKEINKQYVGHFTLLRR